MRPHSTTTTEASVASKSELHPRNRNNGRYDLQELTTAFPELGHYLFTNRYRRTTIDFSDPEAVRTLNTILLKHHYGIRYWEIPKDHLCPPIPGRADYLHYAADLLGTLSNGTILRGKRIRVLDIGTGSSCIYPLIGRAEYGWTFVGTDVDKISIESARTIIAQNSIAEKEIEIREQTFAQRIFNGIILPQETFDLTICNPPFHTTLAQAIAGTKRKWKNLGAPKERSGLLNFGGRHNELVYPGGEEQFITTMVKESAEHSMNVLWFTTLVSRQSLLPKLQTELKQFQPKDVKIISMSQGQKKSRILAWTFHSNEQQTVWIQNRIKQSSSDQRIGTV